MASAIDRMGTPSSPTPCSRLPGVALSSASLNRWAASSRCTAGQRLSPSPTYAAMPVRRATSISAGTKPWSPWSCTDGGRRTTLTRTPRSAAANTTSEAARMRPSPSCAGTSASVPMRPGASTVVPDVATKGLFVSSSARARASSARWSVCAFASYCEKSWMKAVWITPSQARAPAARLSRSDSSPRCASTPRCANAAAALSLRARPST